jgi:hypothetical protein
LIKEKNGIKNIKKNHDNLEVIEIGLQCIHDLIHKQNLLLRLLKKTFAKKSIDKQPWIYWWNHKTKFILIIIKINIIYKNSINEIAIIIINAYLKFYYNNKF